MKAKTSQEISLLTKFWNHLKNDKNVSTTPIVEVEKVKTVNLKTISDRSLVKLAIEKTIQAKGPKRALRYLSDVNRKLVNGDTLTKAQRMSTLEILAENSLKLNEKL